MFANTVLSPNHSKTKVQSVLDLWLLIPFLALSGIGLIMIYSASMGLTTHPEVFLFKQLGFFVIGIIMIIMTACLPLKKIRWKVFALIYIVFILVFAFLKLRNHTINGSAGWIQILGFGIQPAEFFKFFLIITYAVYGSRIDNKIQTNWWHYNLPYFVLAGIGIIFIFLQPDLGGATINLAIVIIMSLSLMGNQFKSIKYTSILIGAILLGLQLIQFIPNHILKSTYQLQRLIGFLHPFKNARNAGQQLVNSYYALSNGGLFGVGLGNSIQKYQRLPEPNTDFIMSIVAEELGCIAMIIIILLVFIIIVRSIWLGVKADNQLDRLYCYGVATFFATETIFNIGGVIGLLPITGVTFPFVSYGGSSMLTLSACLGYLFKISYHQKQLNH